MNYVPKRNIEIIETRLKHIDCVNDRWIISWPKVIPNFEYMNRKSLVHLLHMITLCSSFQQAICNNLAHGGQTWFCLPLVIVLHVVETSLS